MRSCDIQGCNGKYEAKGYCKMHYQRNRKGLDMNLPHRSEILPMERLMNHVVKDRGPKGECWEYVRNKNKQRHMQIVIDGKQTLAHRFSWEHHNNQKIPEGMCILHSCDNPPCVNPDHLRTGTNKENAEDREERGRSRNYKGEDNHKAKLTNKDALFIYQKIHSGEMTVKELMKQFNAVKATIYNIKFGRSWSHITKHKERNLL